MYDRIGRWQDSQRFYETPAVDDLIDHAALRERPIRLRAGLWDGCRYLSRLLARVLPVDATTRAPR
ncbi:MAG: hypothetical protein R2715_22945 [Ilumatobacteraceae bacterium]